MVNPGLFRGSRFTFFVGEKADYKAGVEGGYAADALSKIQSRYFRCYPVELPLDEEPSEEFTKSVDDEKADTEQPQPDLEKLTAEEYEAELERLKNHADLIAVRKAVRCDYLFQRPPPLTQPSTANQAMAEITLHEGPRPRFEGFRSRQPLPYLAPQTDGCWSRERSASNPNRGMAESLSKPGGHRSSSEEPRRRQENGRNNSRTGGERDV